MDNYYLTKITIVGDTNVGKTNILKRFINGSFDVESTSTIGVDFYTKMVELNNGEMMKVLLWDTAGQEKYRAITSQYYRNSRGIIIVYDVSDEVSFKNVPSWIETIKNSSLIDVNNIKLLLIGNKSDKPNRAISYEDGRSLAEKHQMMFLETSALKNYNIESAFNQIIDKIATSIINSNITNKPYITPTKPPTNTITNRIKPTSFIKPNTIKPTPEKCCQ